MKTEPVNSGIIFRKQIRIPLKDKFVSSGTKTPYPMDTILKISDSNRTGVFVATDVFILSSSDNIKKSLKEANIDFEEVEDIV